MRLVLVALIVAGSLLGLAQPAEASPPPGYPAMRWVPASASNFSTGRGVPISHVVIHATHGRYEGAIAWMRSPVSRVSAHYIIRASDGEITQMVAEKDTAFHAKSFNRRSIGIELEFAPRHRIAFTEAQYRSAAALTCAIVRRYGIPVDRLHIVGHSELPDSDHTDPGPTWNWDHYMGLIRSCAGVGVRAVVPVAASGLAPGLAFGSFGEGVGMLQDELVRLGFLRASDVGAARGRFGPATRAAVTAFQSAHGLPATGYFGELTAGALSRAGRPAPAAVAQTGVATGGLSLGMRSDGVRALQEQLMRLGHMNVATGYFGPITLEAVKAFQRAHGVPATGYFGPLTAAALQQATSARVGAPGVDLAIGAQSADVRRLQERLQALGYMSTATGYFGPLTREAVRRFQADRGLPATGYYGPLTRAALGGRSN